MTIQEMFNLLQEYRNAVSAVNNLPAKMAFDNLAKAQKELLREEYRLALEAHNYLPYFTPMHCKHCRFSDTCMKEVNKQFGVDFCALYEIQLNDK